jgi:shikimate kinase
MNPAENLFVIGPMGAGKTTVGLRLAHALGLPFFDLDHEIEAVTGVKVSLIFDIEGEPGFRARERTLLSQIASGRGMVLATGGGAILAPENRQILASNGYVLYLETSVEMQLRRLSRDRSRPLLQAPDRREKLAAMASIRNPLYESIADWRYVTGEQSPASTAQQILRALDQHWNRVPANSNQLEQHANASC